MALEQRLNVFNFSSSLSAGCTALDTSLSSLGFANLPVVTGGSQYIPLVLANDSMGKEEVVYLNSHTSGATTATVVRGQENSTAQSFLANDVVRCSPLLRDVAVTLATSSSMPSNPYYGMKVLQTDTNIVVTYTAFGWVDEATVKNDPTRKHHWQQTAAPVTTANAWVICNGIPGTQVGTTGNIATMSAGALTLGKPGLWSLSWIASNNSTSNRNQGAEMVWAGGAFPGVTTVSSLIGAIGGTGGPGSASPFVSWTGYVTTAQAAIPILFEVYCTVTLGNFGIYDVFAEYLGG